MNLSFWRVWFWQVLWLAGPVAALEIQFDYTYDGTGFFSDPVRQQVLEAAGEAWEAKLEGVQTPAIPFGTGGNTWTLKFNRPDTAAALGVNNTSLVNKPLPADTIVIYVGARPDVYGVFLGYAEFAYEVSGTSAWVNQFAARNSGDRFSSFGGAVAFDSDVAWHFDVDPTTKEDFPGQYDFFTLAMHEIGHLLGFNTGSAAYNRLTLGGKFTGARTVALFGGQPDIGTGGHWPLGFQFQAKDMVMRPEVMTNLRVAINPLEVTVLQDLGYLAEGKLQVVLGPAEAVTAGARWRLNGGVERVSGAVVEKMPLGQHTLSFKPLAKFFTPAEQVIEVTAGATNVVNVEYVPVPIPVVTQGPQSSLVAVGSGVTLSVEASASGADLSYIWKKATAVLKGVTSANLVMPAVTLGQAGAYQVQVKSASGTTAAWPANVGVVGAVSAPGIVNETGKLVVKLAVAGPGPGLALQWFRNGQPVNDDAILGISGATQNTLTIKRAGPSEAGAYSCRVRMADASGGADLELFSEVKSVQVRLRPVVNDVVLGPWKVSGSVTDSFSALNDPIQYKVTGLPQGVVLNKVTGQLSGRPLVATTYRLGVSASNLAGSGAVKFFDVVCEDLSARAKGTFVGLLQRNSANHDLGGAISFKVSASGVISGKLSMGGESQSFRAVWESQPGPNLTSSFEIKRGAGQAAWQVVLNLIAGTGEVSGTVAEGLQAPAQMAAWQSDWNAKSQPAAAYQGIYTLAILPESALQELQLVPEPLEPPPVVLSPEGAGYAMLKVSAAGAVQCSGRLADGSTLTRSLRLGREGDLPLHSLFYKGTGSIQGWVKVVPDLPSGFASEVDGSLTWMKGDQGNSSSGLYRSGFPLHALTVIGGTYRATDAVITQLALPALLPNARLAFAGGGIDLAEQAGDVGIMVSILANNKVQGPAEQDNPTRTRITALSLGTGLFKGSFALRDPKPGGGSAFWDRTGLFYGMLVPRLQLGVGNFLLSQTVLDVPVPVKSGLMVFKATP